MPRDLSIADAITQRGCDFSGCENCPFQMLPYKTHACISEKSGSELSGVIDLAKMLQHDVSAFNQLLNNELSEVETDEEFYQVMSVAQAQTIIVVLDDLLAAGQVLYEQKTYFLHREFEARAQQCGGFWLEQLSDGEGGLRLGISRLIFALESIRYFLGQAVEKTYRVEVGRYEFGFIARQWIQA